VNLRSPLSQALGSGSAKEGVAHWWVQRLTAVALVPLTLWFVLSLFALPTVDYFTVRDWISVPWHSVGTLLLVITLLWHSSLGVQVVIEDYVQHHGVKVISLVLVKFLHFALGVAGAFAVLKAPIVLELGLIGTP
jgi:succinate dehydrogenase / fumarate reductase membrane anchor subunit